jgi:general secretion pathway protein I
MTMLDTGRRSRQNGFFLLEVLVAFAILALSLGILLQIVAVGLRNTAVAEEYTQARLYAESLLTTLGRQPSEPQAMTEGQIDAKFYWRSTVVPYEEANLSPPPGLAPYRLVVEVYWQSARQPRSVRLETLRLVPSE